MKLQQIAYIKKNYKGLKMRKEGTGMFDNEHWATVFKIEMLYSDELMNLMNYIRKEKLLAFIGHDGNLFIQ